MENCKIIAIANQKGGTGKTTTAYNMGIALAKIGKKILLVDNDPQTNLTTAFGIRNTDDLSISLHDVLTMLMDGQELPDKSEYIQLSRQSPSLGLKTLTSCLNLTKITKSRSRKLRQRKSPKHLMRYRTQFSQHFPFP